MMRRTAQADDNLARYKQRVNETYSKPLADPIHCSTDGVRWIKTSSGVPT